MDGSIDTIMTSNTHVDKAICTINQYVNSTKLNVCSLTNVARSTKFNIS